MSFLPSTAAFFEAKYRDSADPWSFASSAYEQGRYAVILAALQHRRYRSTVEPGCSVGVLTERLAAISDWVEAFDLSPTAVEQARQRCAQLANVSLASSSLCERLPLLGFDLIILSEIGYYFTASEWRSITGRLVSDSAPGTTILAAHWLGTSPDHRMHGDEVHAILRENPLLTLAHQERHQGFRLDRWERQ